MSTSGVPLQSAQNPAPQPDEDLLAMLGLHPMQMQVAHGLASGAIHPQEVLSAATPAAPAGIAPDSAAASPVASPASAPAPIAHAAEGSAPQPAAPAPVAPPPVLSGMGASPRIAPALPENVTPPTRLSEDQSELARLDRTGSGLSQFQQRHPVLGTMARIGAGVGSAMFPSIAAAIPGTDIHHNVLVGQARGRVAEDLGEQEKEAQIGETGARTAHENAQADAVKNPKGGTTPEESTLHDLMAGDNGNPRINPDTNKPYSYLEAFQKVYQAKQDVKPDKNEKPDSPEQQFIDEFQRTHKGSSVADAEAAYTKTTQKPEHEPRQMVVGPDGTVIELRPGMKVPAGSKTVSGDLTNKPTADEQRRADLSENLNENLDQLEDIVKRRPELFGPLAGRWTELKGKFGSDDPDISALQVLEHQIGMAQISAHGMRSAQGISSAAESIMNGLHSGPAALQNAIKTVRNSVKTFTGDVAKAKAETPDAQTSGFQVPAGAPPAPKEDGHTLKADGKPIAVSKGGQWVAPQ